MAIPLYSLVGFSVDLPDILGEEGEGFNDGNIAHGLQEATAATAAVDAVANRVVVIAAAGGGCHNQVPKQMVLVQALEKIKLELKTKL